MYSDCQNGYFNYDVRTCQNRDMFKKSVLENPKNMAGKEDDRKVSGKDKKPSKKEDTKDTKKEENKKILKKHFRKEILDNRRQTSSDKKSAMKVNLEKEIEALKPPKVIYKAQIAVNNSNQPVLKKSSSKTHNDPLKWIGEEKVEEANTIAEALAILKVREGEQERVEKRKKSAYGQFEERRLAELKSANPHFRLSEVKKIIFKEWQKCPENPINKFGSM